MEGNLRLKIDWARLIVGRKFTFLLCFTLYLRAIAKYKPPWGLYLEGRFNGGSFALRVWGAYIWRGLYTEGLIFGILRYVTRNFFSLFSSSVSPLPRRLAIHYRRLTQVCRNNARELNVYSYFEKDCRKNVHPKVPKGNMGYVQYTFPDAVAVKPTFAAFLQHSQTRPWPLLPFFQISLKNSELKTTQNIFRGCRVHFIRQPFSK